MAPIRAVVAGINDYELAALAFAVPDAEIVAQNLSRLGVDVLLLRDDEATKGGIEKAVALLCDFDRPPMDLKKVRRKRIRICTVFGGF